MDVALTVFPLIPNFGPSVIKLFEYMAAGRAVVATAIGQQAEIIQDDANGLLVAPGDVAGLEAAVDRLIGAPALRERLGEAARATVLRAYTWRHNADASQAVQQAMRTRSRRQRCTRRAGGLGVSDDPAGGSCCTRGPRPAVALARPRGRAVRRAARPPLVRMAVPVWLSLGVEGAETISS